MNNLNDIVVESTESMLFDDIMYLDKKIKRQVDLIYDCIHSGKSLSTTLKYSGMTYDNLVYAYNYKYNKKHGHYLTLEDFSECCKDVPVVSFFSGAGGLDLGLEAAGFMHQLLFEINPVFCETLRLNRNKWNVCLGDISKTEEMIDIISQHINSNSNYDGLFVGGPPCQPFSIAANQRFNKNGKNFKRIGFAHKNQGNLLFDYIALIKYFKPRAFLIENVPGLIDIDGGEQIERAYRDLESCGYLINQPLILKADAYSVPQQRIRMFIIGNRVNREYVPPLPNNYSLPVGPVFNLPIDGLENHITRNHSAESVLRYMMLNYGSRDKMGRVDRLDPLLPSKTVIAGGNAGGGRSHLHPHIPRTISVRECARIQKFPDSYVLRGPVDRQFTQVGNAVPPILAAQLGSSIYKSFF